MNKEKRF